LLRTHRSYLPVIAPLLGRGVVKGMAHITGGGITDNLPRVLPEGTAARVDRATWDVPPIFQVLGEAGRVPAEDMLRTFNMGVGLILVVAAADQARVLSTLATLGEDDARVIGEIEPGPRAVRYV
jgi:phosphoribosylformylglycinamidine cyclo-ligase